MRAEWFRAEPDHWLKQILAVHLDPKNGTAYWLAKEEAWGIDLRREVTRVSDLARLPLMPQEDLLERPVEDFVPRRFHADRTGWITAETGGTTGAPKTTVWQEPELAEAFGAFWADVAEARDFPFGANWLFLGPSGPHVIGKAACVMAHASGSADPYAIDFDPRWIKRFEPDSAGARSYREHLIEQALRVLEHQRVEVIFATPPLLAAMAERMDEGPRGAIRGVHLGGMHVEPEQYEQFRRRDFPNAVVLPGYGNTLFGLTLELEPGAEHLDYYGPGPRLIVDVVEPGTSASVSPGGSGQVLFHRLDPGFMILNMLERDEATKIRPTPAARALGLELDGVRNPQPLKQQSESVRTGLY